MQCPHCCSATTTERSDRTAHGYRRFRCRGCGRGFNERTGSVLNRLQLPTDVVFLIVFLRLRYKLSLRDLAEMFLIRGIVFTHEAVRDWEAKLAPRLTEALRRRRRGKAGRSWYIDETYIKVAGQWQYLYRAIDRDGNLVDVYLSETRDLAAAQAFFRSAKSVTQVEPEQITTDGHTSYPKAIADELGKDVVHRTSQYKNNVLEIDQTWCLFKSKCFRGREGTGELRFAMCFGELSSDRVQRDRQRSATSAYRYFYRAWL
jgi:putative transposase